MYVVVSLQFHKTTEKFPSPDYNLEFDVNAIYKSRYCNYDNMTVTISTYSGR